jgi:hypothetical protein
VTGIVKVYRIGKDKPWQAHLCVISPDASSAIKVLENTLGKDTSDGSGITIKFALAAESR